MILNKQVGVFINLVHNRIKQYLSTIFQESGFNITPEQFLVMDALWNNGVISQQELARIILKDKNSIVKLVDGLEKKGLVVRVADKVDRRKNLIELTDYAHSIKEKVIDAIGSANAAYKTLEDNAESTWNDIKGWADEKQKDFLKANVKYAIDKWGKDEVSSWLDKN